MCSTPEPLWSLICSPLHLEGNILFSDTLLVIRAAKNIGRSINPSREQPAASSAGQGSGAELGLEITVQTQLALIGWTLALTSPRSF